MKNGKCLLVNQVTGVSVLEQRKSSIRKTCDVIFMVFLFAVEGYLSYDRAKRRETTFKGYKVKKIISIICKALICYSYVLEVY